MTQLLATATGALLLTAVLILWGRSMTGAAGLLAVQGVALAGLAVSASEGGHAEVYAMAALLALVKAGLIPALLLRTTGRLGSGLQADASPVVNPTTAMLLAALLTTVAFLASRPLVADSDRSTAQAIPVGIAVVLIGFLVLTTRRQALAQVVGFVVVDNGIGATAVLAAGGLPAIVELGVLADVVLVVVILIVLTRRIDRVFGGTGLRQLSELRD
ncbi:MAG: hypothetical protein ACK5MT_00650 [Actinomycetales bacterium]